MLYNQIQNSFVWKFPHESIDNSYHQLPCDCWDANSKTIEIIKFKLYIIHISHGASNIFTDFKFSNSHDLLIKICISIYHVYGVWRTSPWDLRPLH